ncbi:MAG: esterase family protein [Sphingobacteriales bacterium]|nr:MAG: esterase family protein [Sphingobacteriales bacterium]
MIFKPHQFRIKRQVAIVVVLLFSVIQNTQAAKVDTVKTYSDAMHKTIKAVVITPDDYNPTKKYPVLYILHGYGGNYGGWVDDFPVVKPMADQYNMIMVCADGAVSSWYFDSPVDKSWKYETYVTTELVGWIDKHYSTTQNKSGRAIMGLSMGGHGALYLTMKHQSVFGAAGSMSGGVDIRPFPNNWDISKRLGTLEQQPKNWEDNTVINLVGLLKPDNHPALLIDCGTKDFFYNVNVAFHEKLLKNNISHDFTVRDGGHDVAYWSNSINYQLLFMHLFFEKGQANK